jgi:hypothetical protein
LEGENSVYKVKHDDYERFVLEREGYETALTRVTEEAEDNAAHLGDARSELYDV